VSHLPHQLPKLGHLERVLSSSLSRAILLRSSSDFYPQPYSDPGSNPHPHHRGNTHSDPFCQTAAVKCEWRLLAERRIPIGGKERNLEHGRTRHISALGLCRRGGAWGEGLSVFVLARGNVACEGWLVIQREGETTWVRDRYVAAFTEPTPTPPPTPTEVARTATSVPATAGPLPSTLEPEPDGAGGGGMAAAGFLILAGGAIGAWMWMRSRVPG
jgi:hypothetical protein